MSNKPTEYKLMPLPATQEMLIAGANVSMEITPRQVSRIYEAMWGTAVGGRPKPGQTGQASNDKSTPGDGNGVAMGIAIGSDSQGNVHVHFDKGISWIGFDRGTAISFAKEILQAARVKAEDIADMEVEIEL